MWKPPVNFLTLHYAWIITLGVLSLVIIYPYGNLRAVDAYFFGVSASTESGLNTVNVNDLATYQQVYIYVIPILANMGFINIIVVVVRLHWFERHLRAVAPSLLNPVRPARRNSVSGAEADAHEAKTTPADNGAGSRDDQASGIAPDEVSTSGIQEIPSESLERRSSRATRQSTAQENENPSPLALSRTIQFEDDLPGPGGSNKALYIPPLWKRDRGSPIVEVDDDATDCVSVNTKRVQTNNDPETSTFRRTVSGVLAATEPLERVATMVFRPGASPSYDRRSQRPSQPAFKQLDMPNISSQATIGRNSQFYDLTAEDRERLGGIEYRSLKLLLKIVTAYFFGLHIFGAMCLVPWILHSNPKYREYLADCAQGYVWWGFYSSQTMISNLGFTLTPDSMIHFQDAKWPLLVMSFLGYAGNTCYPVLLRLVVWTMSKLCPKESSMREPLSFLLDHPRRCYTLLFPSKPTWVLFGALFVLNFIDVLLIIVLDQHNPAVNNPSAGHRVVAAIFQAASSRHTGTATFVLADVNPAVQFSLFVMMYIAAFPIAISVRVSNTYEESSLGIYPGDGETDGKHGGSYIMAHLQNQLSFDLWYMFLGVFCICIAESGKIADPQLQAFTVWTILFEVVSAYANVGLSLGFPTVDYSLSGKFNTFSKLVICAMMIRGRHRGLPYKLDRAILLPSEQLIDDETIHDPVWRRQSQQQDRFKRYHTR